MPDPLQFPSRPATVALLSGLLAAVAWTGCSGAPAPADADGDGLLDPVELERGTDPSLADTDGDGRADGVEAADHTDSGSSFLVFHPLIADLPVASVRVVSRPRITLEETLGVSEEVSKALERSEELTTEDRTVDGGAVSRSVESSFSWGVSGTLTSKVSLVDPSVEMSMTVHAEQSETTSNQTSSSWSKEKSRAKSLALSEIESSTRGRTTTTHGGKVQVSVVLENRGNIAWTLEGLRLSAYVLEPRSGGVAFPLPNLTASGESFARASIPPGGRIEHPITFEAALNLQQMKDLLGHQGGLVIGASHLELLNGEQVAFAHNMTEVAQRTAQVVIDYGPLSGRGAGGAGVSEHRVAIPGQFPAGRSLREVLTEVLRLPVEEGVVEVVRGGREPGVQRGAGLLALDGFGAQQRPGGYWVVVHRQVLRGGESERFVRHDPVTSPYSLDDIVLQRREGAHLVYVVDSDGDGLGDRDELRWGTDIAAPDTDGDGLVDGLEVQGWELADGTRVASNPLLRDADFDGVGDLEESERGTDPVNLRFDGTPPTVEILAVEFPNGSSGRPPIRVRLRVDDPDPEDRMVSVHLSAGAFWAMTKLEVGKEQTVELGDRGFALPGRGEGLTLTVTLNDSVCQDSFTAMLRKLGEPDVQTAFRRWGPVTDMPFDEQVEAVGRFAVTVADEFPELYYQNRRWAHFRTTATRDFLWP